MEISAKISAQEEKFERHLKTVGLFLGPLLFFIILMMGTPDVFLQLAQAKLKAAGITPDVQQVAFGTKITLALMMLMVVWWLTEAIPIPATSLLPALILPIFHVYGVADDGKLYPFHAKNSLAGYANPVIYLFLGGFLIAGAMKKWGLDRRLTLWILTRGNLANSSRGVLLGLMAATAFLSLWISNTATAAMMLPLALGILARTGCEPGKSAYGNALMLGVAWAASIGGVGTIVGTPPNGICVSILANSKLAAPNFLQWMAFGIPYVVVFTFIAWLLLIWLFPPEVKSVPGGKESLLAEKDKLGTWNNGELATIAVFFIAVSLWISSPFFKYLLPTDVALSLSWLDEYVIAILAAMLLFAIPVDWNKREFTLNWGDAKCVDWGTLLLFGGGIALSDAIFRTGLAELIATSFVKTLGQPSPLLLVIGIVFLIDFLTEVTSNTAVTSMMVPVIISIARGTGADPTTLAVAAAVAASMAFMLPVATPPNALVFGTGYISIKSMAKAGLWLDITGWILTITMLYVFGYLIFGVLKF